MRLLKTGDSSKVVFTDLIRYNDYKPYEKDVQFDCDLYDIYPSRYNYYFAYDINKESLILVKSSVRDIPDTILDSFYIENDVIDSSRQQVKNYNDYIINYLSTKFNINIVTDDKAELNSSRFDVVEAINISLSRYDYLKDNYNNGTHDDIITQERELQILGSAYMLLNARMDVLGY